jgi:hypothetical protein
VKTPRQAGKFDALLACVKARWSYRDLSAILDAEGISLSKGYGWDALHDHLNGADAVLCAKATKVLSDLVSDLALAGTKDVHIFDVSEAEVNNIALAMAAIAAPANGAYKLAYPMPLRETALKSMTTDHELAATVHRSNGDIALVLCARRTAEERDRYQYSQVTAAVKQAFAGVDEIITIKKTDYQVFDVLTVRPKLRRVEVLIDQPGLIRGPETSEMRCLTILGRALTLVPDLTPLYEANSPINLFPCISALYHAASEGRISKLSFRSPTDSKKREEMTSDKDLRTEPFHAAGVVAVGDITPYDITVVWDSLSANISGGSGVQIGMPISTLSSETHSVRHARIINARSDTSVVAIVNKLVSYST